MLNDMLFYRVLHNERGVFACVSMNFQFTLRFIGEAVSKRGSNIFFFHCVARTYVEVNVFLLSMCFEVVALSKSNFEQV